MTTPYSFLKGYESKIVVLSSIYDKWRKEREKHLYHGVIQPTHRLREILDKEIILEFDHLQDWEINTVKFKKARTESEKWIDKIKNELQKKNVIFKITSHRGKSPHIRFLVEGLEHYPKKYAKEYKLKLAEALLEAINFKSELLTLDRGLLTSDHKLISLEGKPHYKPKWKGNIEEVIYEHKGKRYEVKKGEMNAIITELNKNINLDNKKINLNPIDIKDVNFEGLSTLWKEHYKEGNRNALLMALGGMCRRKCIKFEDAKSLLKMLLESVGKPEYYNQTANELSYSWDYKPEEIAVFTHLKRLGSGKTKGVYSKLLKCFDKQVIVAYPKYSLIQCKSTILKWLHIFDRMVIETVFAFAVSIKMPGDPLWLFLIAPPGGCKTELLRAMEGGDYYHLSDLTSKTFVSGLMIGTGNERQKIDDLLPQLDKKDLIMKDFTTILEKQKDERREIIAQLREIYDGMFSKKFGTLDEKVEYKATFGMLAGVTPIIDKHWKLMQQLGERFLKYRWDEDADATTRKAEANEGKEKQMRKEIKEVVMGFLTNLEVGEVEFPSKFVDPLIEISKFLALCRTPVTISSGKSDFYFDFIPTPERPTRLVKQLKKFTKCLAIVRSKTVVTREEIEAAVNLAFHTCPQDRLDILRVIGAKQHITLDGCTINQIMPDVKLPETSIRNVCEQLIMLDLVKKIKVSKQDGMYSSYVAYYKLGEKVPALTPTRFLESSEKVGGDTAGCELIHHKCSVCGETPCSAFSRTGQPLCKSCQENPNVQGVVVQND